MKGHVLVRNDSLDDEGLRPRNTLRCKQFMLRLVHTCLALTLIGLSVSGL